MYKVCELFLDGEGYQFEVEGDFFWGESKLLFKTEDNVISKMPWKDEGYAVVNAFSSEDFQRLKKSMENNIIKAIQTCIPNFDASDFQLENYHKIVTTDELHNQVINITRNLENEDFDFDIDALANRFGEILGYKLTSWVEELQKSHVQIRLSRPNSLDINPPHRDGYLSYWEDIINVWIPIVGCNQNSSLPVYPRSHLIPENEILRTASKGAKINGNTYYVPCILETKKGKIEMIRPNPKPGEALIFSPFLIHGSAVNKNENITRISLELRFPKIKP
ncbi:phytanoyl-CoA dioxygenase family protein [Psychroserpens algicola]|uniref:Phytanoyl-CoA dioxygenase family protein n=1 Tax=Psychroserpens algicola TaxID=1719034 RepID=A0ABT0H6X3_9FLAO|nr:phytanoyl-CoA dioxygenase family protein [Psychroserpens algicola]MCK8480125.1 phytanoyl-CoA dioxygenase family protein [Psychroserpens algicola]